jgi:hypothetical protein
VGLLLHGKKMGNLKKMPLSLMTLAEMMWLIDIKFDSEKGSL